jgi:TATA-box binding protein (TBP) (component of TFIID and TFIIIB)
MNGNHSPKLPERIADNIRTIDPALAVALSCSIDLVLLFKTGKFSCDTAADANQVGDIVAELHQALERAGIDVTSMIENLKVEYAKSCDPPSCSDGK